jgi:hypothetical protein
MESNNKKDKVQQICYILQLCTRSDLIPWVKQPPLLKVKEDREKIVLKNSRFITRLFVLKSDSAPPRSKFFLYGV